MVHLRTVLFTAALAALSTIPLSISCPAAPADEPEDAAVSWYERGIELVDNSEYQQAIECFGRAIELNPDYERALAARGSALLTVGRYEDAYRDLSRAIGIDPADADAYYTRGLVYEEVNNYEGAAADYSAALTIEPDNVDCLFRRGLANRSMGKTGEAIADFRRACNLGYGYACDELNATHNQDRAN
jgi:tetratricopeptide (TPR) repeat protein